MVIIALSALAVACGPASPLSEPTPEPMATTEPLSTMTPQAMPTALSDMAPAPTAEASPTMIVGPASADTPAAASNTPITGTSDLSTDLKIVELDPEYRPLYVDGFEYAATGPEDHLYVNFQGI